jgi:hypothetical protein
MGKFFLHVLATSVWLTVATARVPAVLGSEPFGSDAIEIVKRQTTGGTLPGGWFNHGCYTWNYDCGEYYPQATYNAPMSAEFCVNFCRTNLPLPAPYTPSVSSAGAPSKRELHRRSYDGPSNFAATNQGNQCSTL